MKPTKFQTACCSRCTHYTPEGRRGGHCGQLGVPVKGGWKACSLAVPVFLTPLPELKELEFLSQPIEVHLPEKLVVPIDAPRLDERTSLRISA